MLERGLPVDGGGGRAGPDGHGGLGGHGGQQRPGLLPARRGCGGEGGDGGRGQLRHGPGGGLQLPYGGAFHGPVRNARRTRGRDRTGGAAVGGQDGGRHRPDLAACHVEPLPGHRFERRIGRAAPAVGDGGDRPAGPARLGPRDVVGARVALGPVVEGADPPLDLRPARLIGVAAWGTRAAIRRHGRRTPSVLRLPSGGGIRATLAARCPQAPCPDGQSYGLGVNLANLCGWRED
ncbi:hypothetical protein B6E66_00555 [Streptomyces maremycinicus]|nr:hypothetical protein B6E66_00555 [Streptomyces sp. B9173]